jgi:DNA-3-methyladenine glycosylase II
MFDFSQGQLYLSQADPILATIISRYGPCTIQPQRHYFVALTEAILSQQLSVKAAATIFMFLIFSLLRPDVLPVDDLGFRKAVQIAYKLRKLPDAKRLTQIAKPWQPYRSLATWYLWASLNNKPLG